MISSVEEAYKAVEFFYNKFSLLLGADNSVKNTEAVKAVEEVVKAEELPESDDIDLTVPEKPKEPEIVIRSTPVENKTVSKKKVVIE
jgi:hypothetical protein